MGNTEPSRFGQPQRESGIGGAGHDDSGEFVPLFSEQVLLNSIALNF